MTYNERLKLFNDNVNLAYSLARKHWMFKGDDCDDISQEALIGLWLATESYNSELSSFTTYATVCINNHLRNRVKLMKFGSIGRSSCYVTAIKAVKLSRDTNMSLNEVCDELKMSEAARFYAHLVAMGDRATVSLDTELFDDDSKHPITLKDLIPYEYDLESEAIANASKDMLLKQLDEHWLPLLRGRITNDKTLIIFEYFVRMLHGEHIRQIDIADEVGITRSAVSAQIQRWNKHLKKLITRSMEVSNYSTSA